MPRSVNRVTLLGHTGKDVEIRYTTKGIEVGQVSIATTERFKDKQGDWTDRTEWHRIILFGSTAKFAAEYVKKGRPVYVEGKLQTRTYEKNGVKHYHTEIVALEFIALNERGERQGSAPADQGGAASEVPAEDIPF